MKNKLDMFEVSARIEMMLASLNLCIDDMQSNFCVVHGAKAEDKSRLGYFVATRTKEVYIPALNLLYTSLFELGKDAEEASV